MAWRAPTESDLLKRVSADELDAFRLAGLAAGEADPVAGQLTHVVEMVRGYVRANPRNRMGAPGTLPEGLIGPAMDYLAVPVQTRVAGTMLDPESARATARAQAINLFRDVAENKFVVESPDEPGDDGRPTPAPAITPPTTTFSRPHQDGI